MGASPAKLNLYLDVLGRRDDGFHELETLFAALSFGDEVEVALGTPDAAITLELAGSVEVPTDGRNLAVRAAQAWAEAAGHASGVALRLTKQVPVGAGLGGGSSNAATVLRLANTAAGSPLDEAQLHGLAADLGSDVPFFLHGGAAVGRGRGEQLAPVEAASGVVAILILPPIACETAVVFRNMSARVRAAPAEGLAPAQAALRRGDPLALREAHYNALAVPALGAYPALIRFTSQVEQRLGRPPCLSGSGAALFDLPAPDEIESVLSALEGLPGRRVVATLCP